MSILNGALAGLGKGMEQVGQTMMVDSLQQKRDARLEEIRQRYYQQQRADQQAMRKEDRALALADRAEQRTYDESHWLEKVEATKEEARLDRENRIKVAEIQNSDSPTGMKVTPTDIDDRAKLYLENSAGSEEALTIEKALQMARRDLLGEKMPEEPGPGGSGYKPGKDDMERGWNAYMNSRQGTEEQKLFRDAFGMSPEEVYAIIRD